jgi:hypothetical protein
MNGSIAKKIISIVMATTTLGLLLLRILITIPPTTLPLPALQSAQPDGIYQLVEIRIMLQIANSGFLVLQQWVLNLLIPPAKHIHIIKALRLIVPVRLQHLPLEVTIITSSTPATSAAALLTVEVASATTGRLLRIASTAHTTCI